MIETGMIIIWSGAIVDIPDGYTLCDGSAGTPDLRTRFVIGAGGVFAPGVTGGNELHRHTINVESVGLAGGEIIEDVTPAGDYDAGTLAHNHGGNTAFGNTIPPFYALAFIMKT